jgi:hypothetical protein
VCGLLVVLSQIWSVPQRVPFCDGQKLTVITQLWPGCRVVPTQLLTTWKSPVQVTWLMQTGWLP